MKLTRLPDDGARRLGADGRGRRRAGPGRRAEAHNGLGRRRRTSAKAHYYRKRTRVYGYSARRGGYSYWPEDVINTYGLTRNKYGSMNSYRDPSLDRQSPGGPFDHGFFFDSGMGPQGGQSPYLH